MKYILLILATLMMVNIAEACSFKEKVIEVKGAFIYDFKGYFTKVGDYPIDNRALEDCKPYSTTCMEKGEYWFCVCLDTFASNTQAVLGIEDKTGVK